MLSSLIRRPVAYARKSYAGHSVRLFTATLKTFALAHVFMDFLWYVPMAEGPSMLPTLEVVGDRLLVDKSYRKGRGIKVGDLVSFKGVNNPGGTLVKRVIGLPGDYVMRNTPGSDKSDMLQVPKGHCWVVGDNMNNSNDSRMFGPVPMALIIGRVTAKVLPFSERRWIEDGLTPAERL